MRSTITYSYLQILNDQVDDSFGTDPKPAEELLRINYSNLAFALQLRCKYVLGKYYSHRANLEYTDTLQNLEKSNEYFDSIFMLASDRKKKVSCPKQWFKRAKTKYTLSYYVGNDEDASCLIDKALDICQIAMEKYPNNSSFTWLHKEITKNL